MNKILCDELQPGTLLRIFDGKDYVEKTVKRLIIMQYSKGDDWCPIHDVEVLICKRKNLYFSYDMYLKGTSWAKSVEIVK